MTAESGKNLGEILLERGVIDHDALNRALQIQNRRLGQILIDEDLADPVAIATALKFQARSEPQSGTTRFSIESRTLDEILTRLETIEDRFWEAGQQGPALFSLVALRRSLEDLLLAPTSSLFRKARWVASRTAAELGKKVALTFDGSDLVVDRAMADELADILPHLIRNAVDHGIEDPQDRVAAGKPETGKLVIHLRRDGSRLRLSVSDDGRGIDEEKVIERAREMGILETGDGEISRETLLRILFTPGFSTAPALSTLSGRGVGLDVVEAGALRLGGEVRVDSTAGAGTTFDVSVPLRRSRTAVIPLRAGSHWIAASASAVARVVPYREGEPALPAGRLFGNKEASMGAGKQTVVLECARGSRWAFDEVCPPELVMVRDADVLLTPAYPCTAVFERQTRPSLLTQVSIARANTGVIGGARLSGGRAVLVIDLDELAGAPGV